MKLIFITIVFGCTPNSGANGLSRYVYYTKEDPRAAFPAAFTHHNIVRRPSANAAHTRYVQWRKGLIDRMKTMRTRSDAFFVNLRRAVLKPPSSFFYSWVGSPPHQHQYAHYVQSPAGSTWNPFKNRIPVWVSCAEVQIS